LTVAVIVNVPPLAETATPTLSGADERTVTVPDADPPPALRFAIALKDDAPDAVAGGVSVTVALPVAPGLSVIAGTLGQPLQFDGACTDASKTAGAHVDASLFLTLIVNDTAVFGEVDLLLGVSETVGELGAHGAPA